MAGSGERREVQARKLHRLFKVVEGTTSSITAATTRSTVLPPTGQAGKIFTVPTITGGSVRFVDSTTTGTGGAQIADVTIANGAITSVDVFNAITAQTVTLAWTFTGNF